MIPHEVVNEVKINKAVYDLLEEKGTTQISRFWVDNQGGLYRRNANRRDSLADAVAATIYRKYVSQLASNIIQENISRISER